MHLQKGKKEVRQLYLTKKKRRQLCSLSRRVVNEISSSPNRKIYYDKITSKWRLKEKAKEKKAKQME